MGKDDLRYVKIEDSQIELCRDLCNKLMTFQAEQAEFGHEKLAAMNFENRMVPSVRDAEKNHILVVMDGSQPVAYAYSTINRMEDKMQELLGPSTIEKTHIGIFSNFYIEEDYRSLGIGSKLFDETIGWLRAADEVDDIFVFVSNGNDEALNFYEHKGFKVSHLVRDGFITALRL